MNSPCAGRPENPSCIFKESTARAGSNLADLGCRGTIMSGARRTSRPAANKSLQEARLQPRIARRRRGTRKKGGLPLQPLQRTGAGRHSCASSR